MKKKSMKILIAGSNSFCGLALSKFFIKKKIHVFGTYNRKKPKIKSKYFISKKIDLKNKFSIKENFDSLIHISSHHKISDFYKMPTKKYKENILMAKNLIQFAKQKRINKLIFFSTIDIKEIIAPIKKKYYIKSKIECEKLYSLSLQKQIFKKVFFLRLPAILGKNCNNHFLKQAITLLKKDKPINIWNDKKLYNNFIHVDDLNGLIHSFVKKNIRSKKTIIECKVKNPMRLIDTILTLKNKLKSKSKINLLKLNNENQQNKKVSTVQRYNFFSAKKSLLLFLKNTKNYK